MDEAKKETESKPQVTAVLGLDIGEESSIVASIDVNNIKVDILRNDLSLQETPSVLCFHDGQRSFGESAKQLASSNANSTFKSFLLSLLEKGKNKNKIPFQDKEVTQEQLLAMFFSKLRSFCSTENVSVAVAVPELFGDEERKAVMTSAQIAGFSLDDFCLVNRITATALYNASKKNEEVLNEKNVLYVDIGHVFSSVGVFSHEGKKVTHLASTCSKECGSEKVDDAVLSKLKADISAKFQNANITRKGEHRLKVSAKKLKETLSGVPKARTTCENVIEGNDVPVEMTREELEVACSSIVEEVKNLLRGVLSQVERVDVCELVGGGMRIPFIKKAITDTLSEFEHTKGLELSYTLDSMTASCIGAAYSQVKRYEPKGAIIRPIFETIGVSVGDQGVFKATEDFSPTLNEEKYKEAVELHAALAKRDEEIILKNKARNQLESYIFEMRSLARGNREFSDLVDSESCLKCVEEADEWLYNVNEDETSAETYTSKLESLQEALKPSCEKYFEKIAEEKAKKEKELEELSKQAAKELEASGGKDDHDFRKLKKPERMKKVMLNKDEGTSLYKDGNIEPAAKRYQRALDHCEKFVDLSEADKVEVEGIKLKLWLNLAMCFMKLEKYDEALKKLDSVLEKEPSSMKALYRRAVVFEKKKDYKKAKADLTKATEIDSKDKAVSKLMLRIEALIKREKAKQKKMAQKMFG